ncbi:hypothetical protein MYP_2501 [Sporocytophaga myxococcoides]|uniref:Uncharacterized protein n=1 Tax=Sporocytophaga myxococcoides TaxID=153721 RepID=A0A098LFR2_9BACT|nr:hypothetical protein MYP_2501 [Sporocytophaga myxococcoides]
MFENIKYFFDSRKYKKLIFCQKWLLMSGMLLLLLLFYNFYKDVLILLGTNEYFYSLSYKF